MIAAACPSCGSENCNFLDLEASPVGVCSNCATAFIPEIRANPAIQMCDDCAWRPGSPERKDPYQWAQMIEVTIEGGQPFYCHKGLTCRVENTNLIYQMPPDGPAGMTPCAGWKSRKLAYDLGMPARRL